MSEQALMAMAQPGLYDELHNHAHYLELHWLPAVDAPTLLDALARALAYRDGVRISVGFGADAWHRLNPQWSPQQLQAFVTMNGQNGHSMPSTQSDVWIWIQGPERADVMAALLHVFGALQDCVRIQLDLAGFKNRQSRDLTGFVDGTANPKEEKRVLAAQIPLHELGAGGSYVLTQKWRHHMKAFESLTVSEQERVIGRTKETDEELRGEAMPKNAHVSRTDVKIDGVGQKIFRRSLPYGNASDHGLYFIGFACDLSRISVQLDRMLGNTGDGFSDRLMDYSTAESGAYWFMPSKPDLDALLAKAHLK